MLRAMQQQQGFAWCAATNGGWSDRKKEMKQCRLLMSSSESFSSSCEVLEALAGGGCTRRKRVRPPSCWRPITTYASLTQSPIIWAVRTCVFYALIQVGVAGRPSSTSVEDGEEQFKWLKGLYGNNEETKQLKRVRNRWQTTTKGTLKRKFRVPTKTEGRRLLNAISSLLSDDDSFRDATSHKGCQIRRENAHAESVCCYNVRALFDELPTLHLVIEITPFPAGPITEDDYKKAEKIEKVLRTGISI